MSRLREPMATEVVTGEDLPHYLRHYDANETGDLSVVDVDPVPGLPPDAKVVFVLTCCGAPTIQRIEGQCRECLDTGHVHLPAPRDGEDFDPARHYEPAVRPCWLCRPDEYPDGFPGIKVAGTDRWLADPA